jgi:hypothetical protein
MHLTPKYKIIHVMNVRLGYLVGLGVGVIGYGIL